MIRLSGKALAACAAVIAAAGLWLSVEPVNADGVVLHALIRPDEGGNVAMWSKKFKDETGIEVQTDFVSWADIYNKTITTLAGGGGGYDVVFIPSANAAEFLAGGWFDPISDLISADAKKDWLGPVVDLYSSGGQLLAMPWYAGGAHMAYNKKILQAAGVDPQSIKTWDDFMAACEKVKQSKAAPFCFAPSAKYAGEFYFFWGTFDASIGGKLFDAASKPIFQNDGKALAASTLIKKGIDKGYFDPAGVAMDDYETLVEFGNGKEAFLLDSTWSVTQANTNKDLSKIRGDADLILIPGGGDKRTGGYLYAGGLGLLKSSQHKEEAKKFLTFLTSREAQKQHAIDGANMPTRVALYQDKDIAAAWTGFPVLAEQLTYGQFAPPFPWFDEWRHSLAASLQDLIRGTKTPEQQIQFLVDEANRIKAK